MAIISILTLVMLWITFLMLSRKEKDSYILEVKIRDAQIRECEKQINPHFLYNSLQMIQMLGLMRDFDGLQEAIVSLGDVLRYSLNGEREVAITSEIENIEPYFRLLKLRYRERLDYSIVCEDDFTQYKMLKNINDRIKLYYGSRYGVMIKSEYGVKTDVMVHIPICFRGDENV